MNAFLNTQRQRVFEIMGNGTRNTTHA